MEENKPTGLQEDSFDELLSASLPEEADPEISRDVTPWRRSMNCILAGLALGLIQFRFLRLDLILPVLSFAYGLLGWYRLRRENRGFRLGWILLLIRTGVFILYSYLSMTVWELNDLFPETAVRVLKFFFLFLSILQLLALKNGIGRVQEKAGLEEETRAITGLILLSLLLGPLAILYNGVSLGIFGWIMLALIIFCLYRISQLSHALDEAGYELSPAPSKLSSTAMMGLFFGILIAGCVLCFVLFSRYPMKWQECSGSLSPAAEEIAMQLKDMGFPEEILADLSEEDILLCEGTQSVMVNEGTYHMEDLRELRVKCAAAVLSDTPRIWRVFYHFSLPDQTNYWGNDALELRPINLFSYIPEISQPPSGRILLDKGSRTLAAAISSVKNVSIQKQANMFGFDSWNGEACFASFSLPRSFQNARGYVTLEVRNAYDSIDFSWGDQAKALILERWSSGLIYIHQTKALQVPVLSPKDFEMQAGNISTEPFIRCWIWNCWFFPGEH